MNYTQYTNTDTLDELALQSYDPVKVSGGKLMRRNLTLCLYFLIFCLCVLSPPSSSSRQGVRLGITFCLPPLLSVCFRMYKELQLVPPRAGMSCKLTCRADRQTADRIKSLLWLHLHKNGQHGTFTQGYTDVWPRLLRHNCSEIIQI